MNKLRKFSGFKHQTHTHTVLLLSFICPCCCRNLLLSVLWRTFTEDSLIYLYILYISTGRQENVLRSVANKPSTQRLPKTWALSLTSSPINLHSLSSLPYFLSLLFVPLTHTSVFSFFCFRSFPLLTGGSPLPLGRGVATERAGLFLCH